MADKTNISLIIVAFITIIVGIPLLVEIADNVFDTANVQVALNEEVDFTTALVALDEGGDNASIDATVVFDLNEDFIITVTEVQLNSSAAVISLTETTDFIVSTVPGTINFVNSTTWAAVNLSDANRTLWNYTFADTYVQDSTSRTFLNLIPLFFVIGLLLMIIAIIFKDNIIDIIGRR